MDIFEKAVAFALNAHSGQTRKLEDIPYFLHPAEAAAIAATLTCDRETLAAVILHDTVEDTDTTLDELRREFGDRVDFVHLRATKRNALGDFYEANLLEGDVPVYEMMKAVFEVEQKRGFRIFLRPDHGHQMCDDLGRRSNPGYSCYGRLRSLAELRGIEHALIAQARP